MGQLHHSLRDNSTVIEYDLSLGETSETRQENWTKRKISMEWNEKVWNGTKMNVDNNWTKRDNMSDLELNLGQDVRSRVESRTRCPI